jgi:hypothetical protein
MAGPRASPTSSSPPGPGNRRRARRVSGALASSGYSNIDVRAAGRRGAGTPPAEAARSPERELTETTFTIIDDGRVAVLGAPEGAELLKRAEAEGRPVAVDQEARAAYLGVTARSRAAALASLEAPGFTLPDLDGRLHSLSEHRGKKVLLVAYASW